MKEIQAIATKLAGLPFADKIAVFGSLAKGSAAPGDIDLFVDLSGEAFVDDKQLSPYWVLIQIARKHYGLVDPFLRFKNALFVRNSEASGWIRATNVRALKKAMDTDALPLTTIIQRINELSSEKVCNHPVGYIPPSDTQAADWNDRLLEFLRKVEDFNVRGQRDQINHPGFVAEFKFCPECGGRIERQGLGLLTYTEAYERLLITKPKLGANDHVDHV